MSDTQNSTWAQAFGQNIMQLAQQTESKLWPCIWVKPNVTGKVFYQDQIGQWGMETKGTRNAQTPNNDPNLQRRQGTMVDYHDARLLDRGDELRTISDPRSAYTMAAGQSVGRQLDDVIIAAALGVAKQGETGSVSVTNGNIILATASSMTLARIVAVKAQMDNQDVPMEDRFFVVTPTALNNLLNTTAATSSDYNSVKALIRGEIDTWMGFKWIQSTRLQLASASGFIGFAFQRYGICAAMLADPIVKADQRADLSYSWQVYYEVNVGAVRMEEARVVLLNEG